MFPIEFMGQKRSIFPAFKQWAINILKKPLSKLNNENNDSHLKNKGKTERHCLTN